MKAKPFKTLLGRIQIRYLQNASHCIEANCLVLTEKSNLARQHNLEMITFIPSPVHTNCSEPDSTQLSTVSAVNFTPTEAR
jgi:hypothetical protein